jgi:hypothetical protein
MGLIDFLLVAGAAIVGVLATAVYGMLALPAGYFRAARVCAILAAIIFTALGVLWATETSYMFLTRALVVGGMAAIAAIALTEGLRQIKHHEHNAVVEHVTSLAASTGELFLECEQAALPEVGIPNQTKFFKIDPFRFGDTGTISYGTIPTEPGKPFSWPEEWRNRMQSSTRCRVTNYGKSPLFNIEIPFKITFVRIKRGEGVGSTTANEIINVADGILPITKLEPGNEAAYVFYIHNQGRDLVHSQFANAGSCLPLGEASRAPVRITQPNDIMHQAHPLWPVRDSLEIVKEDEEKVSKSLPAPPPQAPSQPSTPEKK